jgi:hypothetical protein
MIHDFDAINIKGANNTDPKAAERIAKSNTYRDLSTVWVTPTCNHQLDDQVVFQSWMSLQVPMNQKFCRLCVANAEVGDAYNAAVELILNDQIKWKYMLTVEVDNLPPKDGLLRLYESVDKFDVVGGLYWMKGEGGTPHIYGNPDEPGTFMPQVPIENTVQPCNLMGMGFTLFNVDIFRKLPKPWFKTASVEDTGEFTQDGYFFKKAGEAGFKFAVDNRVKVGHIDFSTRKIW